MQNHTTVISPEEHSDHQNTLLGESSPDTDLGCRKDDEELMEFDSDDEETHS